MVGGFALLGRKGAGRDIVAVEPYCSAPAAVAVVVAQRSFVQLVHAFILLDDASLPSPLHC